MNEIWVSVPEYEGFYEVSNKGRLKSLTSLTKRLKTVTIMKDGYCRVTLSKNGINKKALLHRVVAAAFIGKPNGLTVNHKDGNKFNNKVETTWVNGNKVYDKGTINNEIRGKRLMFNL